MMDFIMVPLIMGIITLGIYKLFELFACRGIGLGLLIGFFICASAIPDYLATSDLSWNARQIVGIVYGSSVLLFGGAGLITAFLIENKMNKKKEDR